MIALFSNFDINKKFKLMGSLLLLPLLFMAVYFNQERLYGDSAYYLFKLVNERTFNIEHKRPIGIIVEIIPLFLVYMHASMRSIILAFSINEWLYLVLSFAVLAYVLKDPKSGFAMLLTYVIGARWNYFNFVSELILSTPLFYIFYTIYNKNSKSIRSQVVLIFLSALLIFNHPLNSLFLPFILLMHGIVKKEWPTRNTWILYVIIFTIIIAHHFLIDTYEKDIASSPVNALKSFIHFNFTQFFSTTIPYAIGSVVFYILAIFGFINQKKWLALFVFALFVLGYYFFVIFKFNSLFPDTIEPLERYMFPITLITLLVYFFYCQFDSKSFMVVLWFFIALLHLGLNISYGFTVKKRYELFRMALRNTSQLNEQKLVYRAENYYAKKIGHDWSMLNESLLLSSLDGAQKVKQVYILESMDPKITNGISERDFLYYYWTRDIKVLNTDYFLMKPSKLIYANTDSVQSDYSVWFFKNIKFIVNIDPVCERNKEMLVPITILNQNKIPLTSGKHKENVNISYHWQKGGAFICWDGLRSPIMADVYKKSEQFLLVKTPEQKGNFKLVVDIIYEGKRWAEINSEKSVEIK